MTITTSPDTDQLAAALVAALSTITDPAKNQTADIKNNDGKRLYSYSYAGLPDIAANARQHLAANELIVIQSPTLDQGAVTVTTRIVHSSGQWLESAGTSVTVSPKAGPQDIGSAITYARRYDLTAILGIVPDDDDDGARAQQRTEADELLDQATSGRIGHVQAELRRLSDAEKELVKVWAGGRSLAGPALAADLEWLSAVENRLDELSNDRKETN